VPLVEGPGPLVVGLGVHPDVSDATAGQPGEGIRQQRRSDPHAFVAGSNRQTLYEPAGRGASCDGVCHCPSVVADTPLATQVGRLAGFGVGVSVKQPERGEGGKGLGVRVQDTGESWTTDPA